MTEAPKPSVARDFAVACLLGLLGFSLFGLAASLIVAIVLRGSVVPGDDALAIRSLFKALCFVVVGACAALGLWKIAPRTSETPPGPPQGGLIQYAGILAALLLLPPLLLPNLNVHPWTAPDELYHFTVARNLAEHGVYGSGSPDKGFRWFDPYDSVGAPVIVPVALAFKTLGATVAAGRAVMVAYFLLCCVFAWLLLRPAASRAFGLAAACLGLSFGAVYLSRTLYGEVPAFAWFLCALALWRKSLNSPRTAAWAISAGIAAGFAVLTKSVLALSGFACLAVFIHDQLTERRIRWTHCLWPGVGAALAMGGWWLYQATHSHAVASAAGDTLVYYRAYLMAGVGGVLPALKWCVRAPVACALMLLAVAWAGTRLARRGGDPALRILWVTAMLYAGWWMLFTPANIPRYFWYTSATASLCLAWMLCELPSMKSRIGACLVAALAVIAGAMAWYGMFSAVQRNEMADDYAVAEHIAQMPADARIVTDYWPMERSMDFLARRNVAVIAGPDDPAYAAATCLIRKRADMPPPGMTLDLSTSAYEVWRR